MECTDMERRILDMWPKFEGGSYVWFGDAYSDEERRDKEVEVIEFNGRCVYIAGHEGFCTELSPGDRVKRPAPKVLDADGVEVKVDDTVWLKDGTELLVEEVNRYGARCFDGETRRTLDPKLLIHTQPDSWERLEEDAAKGVCEYAGAEREPGTINVYTCCGCRFDEDSDGPTCDKQMAHDIVRRARALAEKEAAR